MNSLAIFIKSHFKFVFCVVWFTTLVFALSNTIDRKLESINLECKIAYGQANRNRDYLYNFINENVKAQFFLDKRFHDEMRERLDYLDKKIEDVSNS